MPAFVSAAVAGVPTEPPRSLRPMTRGYAGRSLARGEGPHQRGGTREHDHDEPVDRRRRLEPELRGGEPGGHGREAEREVADDEDAREELATLLRTDGGGDRAHDAEERGPEA